MLEVASHCYSAARSCDTETPLALSRYPPGLLPKPVVGLITRRPDGAVLEPILPARQICVNSLCSGYTHWQQREELR
jgi:hypothetical protein